MKTQKHIPALLLGLAALATFGCPRRVVTTAAMPAPLPPRTVTQNQTQPPADPPPAISATADSTAQQAQLPSPDPESEPAAPAAARGAATPAKPRTGPADADVAKAGAESAPTEAPVIAPVLSQREVANAMRSTNNDQNAAQRTLLIARSHRLNAAQTDLYDKVKGFLDQTEDAKKANDWVRAQNLAHKAQVLAAELMKGL